MQAMLVWAATLETCSTLLEMDLYQPRTKSMDPRYSLTATEKRLMVCERSISNYEGLLDAATRSMQNYCGQSRLQIAIIHL